MPSVCAIVPTFNRSRFLIECLESLLAQSHKIDEIIVINDGSTDDTSEAIKPYLDRVTYFEKENGGKAAALNFALAKTESDYIWICDDDDLADVEGLSAMMGGVSRNPEAGFVFGRFQKFYVDEQSGERVMYPPDFDRRAEEGNVKINFLEDMFVFQFAILVKRSVYEVVGGFREDLLRSQDYDAMVRISRHEVGEFVDSVIFYQREHGGVRGPQQDLIKQEDMATRWMTYDQAFFSEVARDYAIDEFCPSFARDWEESERLRASYVQKGAVLAKKALWREAVTAFGEACAASDQAFSAQELHVCEVIIHNPQSWLFILKDQDALGALAEFSKRGTRERSLVFALARSLKWMIKDAIKDKRLSQALKFLKILVVVLGFKYTIRRLLK